MPLSDARPDGSLPSIGCHISLGRKPRLSIQEASDAGASCLQVFASSPAVWKPPVERPEFELEVTTALADFRVQPLVIHAIYLINLASDNPEFVRRSLASLKGTLLAGARLGARTVITHIGSHGGRGFEAVAPAVATGLVEVLAATDGGIDLALENSAGSGGILGSTLDELVTLLCLAGGPSRLKVALDTAHLTGAGWDFTQPGEAARLVAKIEESVGFERLAALHCNDSKAAPGSRRDRHAPIGEGFVGLDGFATLLDQPELRSVPWILETPDLDTSLPPEEYMRSLRVLQDLARDVGSNGTTVRASTPNHEERVT
jgi:deoxyribonuclease-4